MMRDFSRSRETWAGRRLAKQPLPGTGRVIVKTPSGLVCGAEYPVCLGETRPHSKNDF
jgi:hypothetical protein